MPPTVGDAHDSDGDDLVVDRVHDAILASSSSPEAGKLAQQWLSDPLRVVRQGTSDELPCSRCHVLRQVVLECAASRWRDLDPVGHDP